MKALWLASGGLFGLLALAAIGEARPPAAPAPGRPSPALSLPSPHADTIPPLRPGDPTIRGVDRKMVGAGLGMTKKPARYNIPVVVLTPCLDDGTACATIQEATLKADLAETAEIFRQSGLDLRFDPVTVVPIHNTDVAYDFPSISPYVVDTAISQGLVVPHPEGKTIGTKKMYVPDKAAVLTQTTLTANDRARAAAALTWSNSLVLIARHFGNEYVELDNKWQASVGPGGGYSSIHLPYVAIVENNSPSFLAHEIGHYLDLGHTHGAAPKDLGELQALLKQRKDKHAPQLALDDVAAVQKFVDAALDGDALADTAPDPAYWIPFFGGGDPHVGPCTAPDVLSFDTGLRAQPKVTATIAPPRHNAMSYFKHCREVMGPQAWPLHFTPQQVERMEIALHVGPRAGLWRGTVTLPDPVTTVALPQKDGTRRALLMLRQVSAGGRVLEAPDKDLKISNSNWQSLDGLLADPISGVAWGPGRVDVFARGLDGAVHHRARVGADWQPSPGWRPLGGAFTGAPAAVATQVGQLHVVGRGTDGAVWHAQGDGATFGGWASLGGKTTHDPAVVSWGPGRFDVFVRGLDGAIYQKAWLGGSWWPSADGFQAVGPGCTIAGKPVVAAPAPGKLLVGGTDDGGALVLRGWNGAAWSPAKGCLRLENAGRHVAFTPSAGDVVAVSQSAIDGQLSPLTLWRFNSDGQVVGGPTPLPVTSRAAVSLVEDRGGILVLGTDLDGYYAYNLTKGVTTRLGTYIQ